MTKQLITRVGIILLAGLLVQWEGAVAQDADVKSQRPLVFVITGESNSGGSGKNSSASEKERSKRSCVQIMNLTDGKFGFEDMQLGVNNLRDHSKMTEPFLSTRHGFENELANSVEANAFPGHKHVYLIKTGHGGSRISQWTEDNPSGYWKKFEQRIEAGKKQLSANPQWVVWFSLGINDALAKTPVSQWKKETRVHLKRIQAELPGSIIVMTQFESMGFPKFNAAIAEIANTEPNVFAVNSKEAALTDIYHWSYAGLKTVTQRMIGVTQKALNTNNE
ncbi:MAG: hypothetical protein JKY95_01015 [Planctomycetaceae bacterium]|nr:hypothetical protein [Planctomycetaceae bacterium]